MVMRLAQRLALIFTDCFVQLSPLNLCHVDLLHEETPRSIPENCGSAPTGWGLASGQRAQGRQGTCHPGLDAMDRQPSACARRCGAVRWVAMPVIMVTS